MSLVWSYDVHTTYITNIHHDFYNKCKAKIATTKGRCFKESCCHLLCKHPGLRQRNQLSSGAGEELPTSWYSSTDKNNLVNLPAN